MNNHEKALQNLEKALENRIKLYGENDYGTAKIYRDIGKIIKIKAKIHFN